MRNILPCCIDIDILRCPRRRTVAAVILHLLSCPAIHTVTAVESPLEIIRKEMSTIGESIKTFKGNKSEGVYLSIS